MDMLDIEKLTFFLFCGNKRRLQKAGKQVLWLMNVTLPFYVSFWISFSYLVSTTSSSTVVDNFTHKQ